MGQKAIARGLPQGGPSLRRLYRFSSFRFGRPDPPSIRHAHL